MCINARLAIGVLFLSFICGCNSNKSRLDSIINNYENASTNVVLVAAHRGEYDNCPENSISSIEAAIQTGADIAEIDVRKTKDGQLVLMHDANLDRTTNARGRVNDRTLNELKQFYLKMPDGTLSQERIPTLKEAMLTAKGRIMVNLDKSESVLNECILVLKETHTERQAILKGEVSPTEVKKILAAAGSKSYYMPIIFSEPKNKDADACTSYRQVIDALGPDSVELVFNRNDTCLLNQSSLDCAKTGDSRLWCNSLNGIGAGNKGEHEDAKALADPEGSWGWMIRSGISIIQTDESAALLEYLRSKGLHN